MLLISKKFKNLSLVLLVTFVIINPGMKVSNIKIIIHMWKKQFGLSGCKRNGKIICLSICN